MTWSLVLQKSPLIQLHFLVFSAVWFITIMYIVVHSRTWIVWWFRSFFLCFPCYFKYPGILCHYIYGLWVVAQRFSGFLYGFVPPELWPWLHVCTGIIIIIILLYYLFWCVVWRVCFERLITFWPHSRWAKLREKILFFMCFLWEAVETLMSREVPAGPFSWGCTELADGGQFYGSDVRCRRGVCKAR